jgi:phage N-6-adenine-methyltransferase
VKDDKPTLAEAGIDKHLAHRARKLAAMPLQKFEARVDDWRTRHQVESTERVTTDVLATKAHVSQNTGEVEWYTPAEYIEAARQVLGGIDLDPASSEAANAVVKAERFFGQADDGLTKDWQGRVWMNPPYAQPAVGHFTAKLALSVESGDVSAALVLVNNATETEWFANLARVADAICFPNGRVRFWSPGRETAAPLQGQALVYVGPDVDRFAAAFNPFGFVAQVLR